MDIVYGPKVCMSKTYKKFVFNILTSMWLYFSDIYQFIILHRMTFENRLNNEQIVDE